MTKPEYIQKLELKDMFSIALLSDENYRLDFFDNKFFFVWGESYVTMINTQIVWREKIYKTKQGYYLYLLRNEDKYDLTIYYPTNQHDELIFFIKNLKKELENARNNNTRN